MSNEWNINNIRKIAGLPLMEAFRGDDDDEDEDEDPDVAVATKDKRQAAFEKKNKGELSAAEKAAKEKDRLAKEKAAAKKEVPSEKKAEPEAEKKEAAPAEKAEDKKEASDDSNESNEAKKRGRKPSDSSKMGQARAWITSHPEAKRGEFMTHAESFGMTKHYANAFFYTVKKKMKVAECYVLTHPQMPSFLLAENREISQMQWIDPSSPLEPMIFESREEAEKIVKYMSEWKSQYADILTIKLID